MQIQTKEVAMDPKQNHRNVDRRLIKRRNMTLMRQCPRQVIVSGAVNDLKMPLTCFKRITFGKKSLFNAF